MSLQLRTTGMRLALQRVKNTILEAGQGEELLNSITPVIAKYDGILADHQATVQGIQNSTRLSAQGIKGDTAAEITLQIKRLAEGEKVSDAIAQGIKELDAAVTNKTAVAMGKNIAEDPMQQVIRYLQEAEIRRMLEVQQPRAEEQRLKSNAIQRKHGLAVSDEELETPDVTLDAAIRAASKFNDDPQQHRTMLRAILQSPVPLLSEENTTQVMGRLQQSVAGDALAQRQAAVVRADALQQVFRIAEDGIRNPTRISIIQEERRPVSDQERQLAEAA